MSRQSDQAASWQQHDLRAEPAQRIITACEVLAGQGVFEIGPGTGALTAPMLQAGAQVLAVEIDQQRVTDLTQRFAAACADDRLRVVHADACSFTPPFTQPWRVIANPPFQHTAALVRHWLLNPPPAGAPHAIDLLIQSQAAEKLSAAVPACTRSSVLLSVAGVPRVGMRLKRTAVSPPARVDMALWSWRRHESAIDLVSLRALDQVLQQAFRGDHSVRQALRGLTTPAILKRQAKEHGWDPDGPARAVPPAAWLSLSRFLLSIQRIDVDLSRAM